MFTNDTQLNKVKISYMTVLIAAKIKRINKYLYTHIPGSKIQFIFLDSITFFFFFNFSIMTLPSFFALSMDTVVIASMAVLLVIYHFILIRWCNNTRQINVTDQAIMPENSGAIIQEFPSIFRDSINELIPQGKFSKEH